VTYRKSSKDTILFPFNSLLVVVVLPEVDMAFHRLNPARQMQLHPQLLKMSENYCRHVKAGLNFELYSGRLGTFGR
jgi:hypothetical protein